MDLANKVRKKREELGWSQEELATKMGYSSRTSINKIEMGRPCSQKIIARLADALGVSIAYLMGWDQETIDATDQMQNDIIEYYEQKDKAILEFIQTIQDLELESDELEELIRYARYIKQNRK